LTGEWWQERGQEREASTPRSFFSLLHPSMHSTNLATVHLAPSILVRLLCNRFSSHFPKPLSDAPLIFNPPPSFTHTPAISQTPTSTLPFTNHRSAIESLARLQEHMVHLLFFGPAPNVPLARRVAPSTNQASLPAQKQ